MLQEYDTCCGQSTKPECTTICKNYIKEIQAKSPGKKQGMRKRLNIICERESSVLSCVANLTQSSTVHNTEKCKS